MNIRLGAGVLFVLLSYAVQATTVFCEKKDESAIREWVQHAYAEANLVALLNPEPAGDLFDGDENFQQVRVRAVWKGTVGPTIYIDELDSLVVFARRDGESGPFESIDPCTSWYADATLVEELFGPSYPPSDEIRETLLTPLEKAALVAVPGVGLAILVGCVWVLFYIFGKGRGNQ